MDKYSIKMAVVLDGRRNPAKHATNVAGEEQRIKGCNGNNSSLNSSRNHSLVDEI